MPGRCIRLWGEVDLRPAETEAEIRRIDLSSLVLECLLWGVKERLELPWLEPPPEAAWYRAVELLKHLDALDNAGRPTDRGMELTKLGLDPRLAQLCITGRETGRPGLACAAAAILSERDGSGINGDGDFSRRLSMVRNSPNHPWVSGIIEIARDLLRRLYLPVGMDNFLWTSEDEADMGELLAPAFPDRIAALQESGKFRFVSGREARIEGPLERSEWLVAPEVDAGERSAFIRLAAPITKERALDVLQGQIASEEHIEWKGLIPRSRIICSAGRLVISAEQRTSHRDAVIRDLPELFEGQGLALLPWGDEGQRLLERIRFFTAQSGAHDSRRGLNGDMIEAASWTDEALIHESPLWLGPFIWEGQDTGKGPIIDGNGLKAALEARLGFAYKRDLDTLVPAAYTLPKGKQRKLDYDSGEPLLRVRLQDCFGISGAPCIMGVPIVFCLLSPADRPLQTTRDLPGFWKGSYAEVRKEMRGRYPKHHWPEI
ncbi:hypothetical protein FACS189444_6680 [Spirochaetia bacterium]|nr:hypothetical protein FACS189444_6680 [Spirochaetia bacterium]